MPTLQRSGRLKKLFAYSLFLNITMAATLPAAQPCVATMNGKLPSLVPTNFVYSGVARKYYVAAEQIVWDYAPTGWDNWMGVPLNVSPRASMNGYTGQGTFGTKWLKALYRGYSDASFSTPSTEPDAMGLPGPPMRAEVGDMIEILFVNNLTHNYAAIHAMGLGYSKYSEGSDYPNNTRPGQESGFVTGDALPPGTCWTYKWLVTNDSSPTASQPSQHFGYHSFVNSPVDINSGLVGPVVIYKSGQMASTMRSNREFFLLYNIFDETMNFLSGDNARMFGNMSNATLVPGDMGLSQNAGYGNYSIWHPQVTNMPGTMLNSTQAPSFDSLNGYILANSPTFEMCQNDNVIWYVYAYGSHSHVFHLHGNNFQTWSGEWQATYSLNNGIMAALNMKAALPGKWEVLCHVNKHFMGGMVDNYMVYPTASCPLPALQSS